MEATIGRGAMGTVWRAYDDVVHRRVAIKEINFPRGMPSDEISMLTDRTLREARAIGALSHPHVITLFDILTVDGRPFIVMELLDARSLADVLKQDGPLLPGQAGTIGVAVAGGLLAAHRAGITHRDVKPGNVLVGHDGRIKLTDFGIARSADEPSLTATGLLLGSPAYISPEVANGVPASPSSDAWGLGAMLFATVEGRPPFDRGDPIPTLTAVVADPVPPHPHSGPLGPVIDGLLTKNPDARMTITEAGRRLRAIADDPTGMHAEVTRRVPGAPSRTRIEQPSRSVGPVGPAWVSPPHHQPLQPPPPWAQSGAAALPALPAVAASARPRWLIPVAALVLLLAATAGYFMVRLVADWAGQLH